MSRFAISCDTMGFFARTIDDLQLIVKPFSIRTLNSNAVPSRTSLRGAKVAFLKTHEWPKAGPGLHSTWDKARCVLANSGAIVEDAELASEFSNIPEMREAIVCNEAQSSFQSCECICSSARVTLTESFDRHIIRTTPFGSLNHASSGKCQKHSLSRSSPQLRRNCSIATAMGCVEYTV